LAVCDDCQRPGNLLHRLDDNDNTTGRGQGGSGLGLAIVYNLVTESLQGALQISSQVGQGTIITVTFPQVINT
jgi:signal transduction histidine kinase